MAHNAKRLQRTLETFVKDSKKKQDCSYQGEALNIPTAVWGFMSSNNTKK